MLWLASSLSACPSLTQACGGGRRRRTQAQREGAEPAFIAPPTTSAFLSRPRRASLPAVRRIWSRQVAHMAAEMCISPSPAERPSRKRCLEDPTSVVTPPVNPDVAWPAVAQPAARYLPSPDSKRHRPIMLGTVSVRTHGVSGRARDLELTFPSSVIIGHRLKLLVAEAMQTHVGAVRLLCTRTKRLIEDHDEVSSSTSLVVVQQFGGAHPWRSIY